MLQVMNTFQRKGCHEQEAKPQEVVSKGCFMSMIGLKSTAEREAPKEKPEQLDGLASQIKEEYMNKNYYVRLGQAAHNPVLTKKQIDENCNDFSSLNAMIRMAAKVT